MTQPSLFPVASVRPAVTDRQGFALDQLRSSSEGLSELELGILMHERRGKHTPDELCGYCQDEGRQVAIELRKKGLARRRKHTGRWYATALARQLFGGLPMGELHDDIPY